MIILIIETSDLEHRIGSSTRCLSSAELDHRYRRCHTWSSWPILKLAVILDISRDGSDQGITRYEKKQGAQKNTLRRHLAE